MPFDTHGENGLTWLTSPQLLGVRHGFSTRGGGVSPAPFDSLNLRTGCGDSPESLRENFRRFCGAIGADVGRVVLAKQVHETTVRRCTAADAGKGLWSERDYTADALITDEKDLPLAVFSADCGIILLYDPVHPAIGAIHALRESGLRIPEDMAVMGFDNLTSSKYIEGGITTIANPYEDMLSVAVHILTKRTKNPQMSQQQIALRPNLVVRHTT